MQSDKGEETFQDLKKFIENIEPGLNYTFEKNSSCGFRLKAKLAVRALDGKIVIGLFKEGTHDIIDKQGCILHHPSINKAITEVKNLIKQHKIAPYDENTHKGVIRYLQLLVNDREELQIVLVVTGINEVIKDLAHDLFVNNVASSVWINVQNQITNTIFSENFEHISGEKMLGYEVFNKTIYFHPGSFCQANLLAFTRLIKVIDESIGQETKALDLYSGVGLFGLCLEKHFETIIFAETNPFSKQAFEASIKEGAQKQFIVSEAQDVLKDHLDADVVFIDPPRKGLEKTIKPLLGGLKKGAKVFYVSCGALSLMRDLKELLALGFKLNFIRSYQFFPGSKEIETLCILEKNS